MNSEFAYIIDTAPKTESINTQSSFSRTDEHDTSSAALAVAAETKSASLQEATLSLTPLSESKVNDTPTPTTTTNQDPTPTTIPTPTLSLSIPQSISSRTETPDLENFKETSNGVSNMLMGSIVDFEGKIQGVLNALKSFLTDEQFIVVRNKIIRDCWHQTPDSMTKFVGEKIIATIQDMCKIIHVSCNTNLNSTEEKLVDVEEKLAAAEAKLAKTEAELADTKAKLVKTEAELADTKVELAKTGAKTGAKSKNASTPNPDTAYVMKLLTDEVSSITSIGRTAVGADVCQNVLNTSYVNPKNKNVYLILTAAVDPSRHDGYRNKIFQHVEKLESKENDDSRSLTDILNHLVKHDKMLRDALSDYKKRHASKEAK